MVEQKGFAIQRPVESELDPDPSADVLFRRKLVDQITLSSNTPDYLAPGSRSNEAGGMTSMSVKGLPPESRTPRWLTIMLSAK